jgi:hypothetical protein
VAGTITLKVNNEIVGRLQVILRDELMTYLGNIRNTMKKFFLTKMAIGR